MNREEKIQILRKIIADFINVYDSQINNFSDINMIMNFKFRSNFFIILLDDPSLSLVEEKYDNFHEGYGPDFFWNP